MLEILQKSNSELANQQFIDRVNVQIKLKKYFFGKGYRETNHYLKLINYFYQNNNLKMMKKYINLLKDIDINEAIGALGIYYITKDKYGKAKQILLEGCDNNYDVATFRLGVYYEDIEENKEEMIYYYLRAIELGSTTAIFKLANY